MTDRKQEQATSADRSEPPSTTELMREIAVDIKEEPGRFVLFADIPGVDPEQIDVQMDKGILTIKGERSIENVDETASFSRIERRYGSFHWRFALPDSADPDAISASGRYGVFSHVCSRLARPS